MPRGVAVVDTVGVREKGSIWERGETQKHSFNDLQTFVYDFTISRSLLETRKLFFRPYVFVCCNVNLSLHCVEGHLKKKLSAQFSNLQL